MTPLAWGVLLLVVLPTVAALACEWIERRIVETDRETLTKEIRHEEEE